MSNTHRNLDTEMDAHEPRTDGEQSTVAAMLLVLARAVAEGVQRTVDNDWGDRAGADHD